MIDQASVYADRYKGNRQALQAAVLGQNTEVDPYTALRALQLLKESDSMQMAQQAQQPTDAPSLLQEAMQRPQMPVGMPIPGQQMAQAPQQGGGLEAMPVPEGDYAGGGIVAFAGGGNGNIEMLRQKAQEAKRLYETAARSGDTRASDLYLRQQQDAEAQLAEAIRVIEDQTDSESTRLSYHQNPLENNREMLMERPLRPAQRLRQRDLRQLNPPISSGVPAAQAAQPTQPTQPTQDLRSLRGAPMDMPPVPQVDTVQGDYTQDQLQLLTGSRPVSTAPSSAPRQDPLRAQEVQAGISYGSVVPPDLPVTSGASTSVAQTPPAINQARTGKQKANETPAANAGLGALATTSPLGTELDTRLKALDEFAFTDSEITPPRSLTEKISSAKDGTFNALKDLYGTDEASAKAQTILDKRLADLDDPDSKKFDKALAWFKGAAAMQKGRGLEAVANAAGEVAGTYSTIKKEDRKARQLIEDSQMAIDKAKQARKDGMIGKAYDLEEKADKDRMEAEKLQAEIANKQDTAKAGMLSTAARVTSQKYNTDVTAISAQRRDELTAEANRLQKQGLLDSRRLAAFNAASSTLERAEKNIADIKSSQAYTKQQEEINTFGGSNDSTSVERVKAAKAAIAAMDKDAQRRLSTAQNNFNAVATEIFKDSGIKPSATPNSSFSNEAARKWLKENPNDPRAKAVREKLGSM